MSINSNDKLNISYCTSLTQYKRRKTRVVNIGGVPMGGDHPIRVQSMTTVDTMDTQGSVEQVIRMVDAGCEYVRITAPSIKEAENLRNIRSELHKRGYHVPLVADIHFTPNAAELAAKIVEKVRVNPGNYADKKKFEVIEYTDESYQQELNRIKEKFSPLVQICKEHGTAMRIGTNHGSLSDRIMSRYGDTPYGMVESALEFIRICEDLDFYDIVVSMKSSNPQVMVQAYRLLVQKLDEEGLQPYPLHLGVTEAGDGEDGRIKSAVGIGTLLEDGLGDTVRVSLTEEPEAEAPVARALVDRYTQRHEHSEIPEVIKISGNPFEYSKRATKEILNFGGDQVPRVIADFSLVDFDIEVADLKSVGHFYLPELDKWSMNDLGCDYIYSGDRPINFMLPNGLREILNYSTWLSHSDKKNKLPLLSLSQWKSIASLPSYYFLSLSTSDLHQWLNEDLSRVGNAILVLETENAHAMADLRRAFYALNEKEVNVPCVVRRVYDNASDSQLNLYAATDMGGLLIDGFGDGVMLFNKSVGSKQELLGSQKTNNSISFGVLQASRQRMTKTEYISCPSCGRTLFDLQETTAMIRKRTDHLKGVKIGIMGCIVNGPGEMADADYGYVGSGKGKITLYKGQDVVKKNVSSGKAVDELIEIIRQDGKWIEPKQVTEV
ncbi:MAG: (E)-4-hydroxy-3-methylbut-2-enyl-diphosphate synthase [Cyclobacteriaceae bacterium]|nr:(E)-4-hydroxy-3-methylbut-2-enyl-diphosphate synthase [Cyclobacteriaceae bacterium]MCH8516536.1 (E)-4-hydroxy-3-methylbut-2-enyl-diphosphate synthase [Cyclobacteriaceae bacterium]